MRALKMAASMALGVGLVLGLAGEVSAQQMPQEPLEVTDEMLERFVEIYPEVVNISRVAQAELSETADPADAQAIQEEANDNIQSTLEEVDMDFREYDGIVQALNADAELLEEFEERLVEVHGENPLEEGGGG